MLDVGTRWELHPSVSVRPEPFGALVYHFGTRRLSFLKDLTLVALVRALGTSETVDHALDAVGVAVEDRPRYVAALDTLARSQTIRARVA